MILDLDEATMEEPTPDAPPADPARENRRLRAALEQMRSRQNFARGGWIAAAVLLALGHQLKDVLAPATYTLAMSALGALGLAVIVVTAIPFLRSTCPKCRQRYHSPASLLRSANDPPPCKHCGFRIDKHVSRYS